VDSGYLFANPLERLAFRSSVNSSEPAIRLSIHCLSALPLPELIFRRYTAEVEIRQEA
jgi:hypothetical protein